MTNSTWRRPASLVEKSLIRESPVQSVESSETLPKFVCRINLVLMAVARRNIECGAVLPKCDETLPVKAAFAAI